MTVMVVLVAGLTALAAPGVWADGFAGAGWLRHPLFEGSKVITIEHKDKAPKPEVTGPRNVHTYFRKEIELRSKPSSATLWVTADDYAMLYINAAFVVQGPESGYPFAHPYYEIDVTPFLQAGANCVAAEAYYQGLLNRVWNSADNRSGFMLALDVTFEDGTSARFVTDNTWRCLHSKVFPTGRTIGYDTQFAEDMDMRQYPVGWHFCGYDDSAWKRPLVGPQDHVFAKSITPPLQHWRVEPVRTVKKGEGHYFYDFGSELVGHTGIRLTGSAGHKLEVRHAEELSAPDTARYEMRANCVYQEFPVLREGDNVIEFYDYRAFRYVEILNAPEEPEVWVDVRHHPFDPEAATLSASDGLLVRIWDLCKNGVRYGCQGGFLDCPSREKGQYLGDALISGHSHLVLTGDGSLTKKALKDFQLSQRICPGIMAVAPGSFMQEIAEHSLEWPMMLRNYYWYTGDRAFTEAMVDTAFEPLYEYFARFENEAGLLTGMKEKWVLVDWPENLRDDYDYEYAKERENAVLNAFYYGSLCTAAEILEALDRDASVYKEKAEKVKAAFIARLLDGDTGLFVDAPGSKHSSLHANAIPLCFGMVPEECVPKVIALIRQKRLSCGVYIAPFVIEACYRAGEHELAYDLITSKDEHSWHEMLKAGATTCMEAWGPDQKWNTSWCHPWSSGPIFLVAEQVMGLKPAEPGWKTIDFSPRPPESLEEAEIAIPLPWGKAMVHYHRTKGYTITVPPGVSVRENAPAGVEVKVVINMPPKQAELTREQQAYLESLGWSQRVGDKVAVWVSVDEQMFRVVEGDKVRWQVPCATATHGAGNVMDSFQTPLGWHSVAKKVGDGAPWGQVFRGGTATGEVWKPGQDTEEDLVLTRVLMLAGEEPGKNKGGNVDSFARCIYIHGTNGEDAIGRPSSHGCVRLCNDDVIEAFGMIPEGTRVLISEKRWR